MRQLFYEYVEIMAENATGLTNGEIKLWELGTWLEAHSDAKIILNIVCLLGTLLVLGFVYEVIKYIVKCVIKNTKKGKRYIES